MPPKRRGVFLIAGTSKSAPAPPIITSDYSRKNRKCNIVNEFQAKYADPAKLQLDLATLAKRHLKPLAASTLSKYNRACWLWLTYFEWLYGSAEKTNATWAEDAKFPSITEVKVFIGYLC